MSYHVIPQCHHVILWSVQVFFQVNLFQYLLQFLLCVPVFLLSIYLLSVVRSVFFFNPATPLVTSSSPYMLSKADDSENVPCFCQFCSIQSSITQYMSFLISSYYLVISPWRKPLNFLNFFFLLFTVNSTILPSVLWELCVTLSPYSALLAMVSCTTSISVFCYCSSFSPQSISFFHYKSHLFSQSLPLFLSLPFHSILSLPKLQLPPVALWSLHGYLA